MSTSSLVLLHDFDDAFHRACAVWKGRDLTVEPWYARVFPGPGVVADPSTDFYPMIRSFMGCFHPPLPYLNPYCPALYGHSRIGVWASPTWGHLHLLLGAAAMSYTSDARVRHARNQTSIARYLLCRCLVQAMSGVQVGFHVSPSGVVPTEQEMADMDDVSTHWKLGAGRYISEHKWELHELPVADMLRRLLPLSFLALCNKSKPRDARSLFSAYTADGVAVLKHVATPTGFNVSHGHVLEAGPVVGRRLLADVPPLWASEPSQVEESQRIRVAATTRYRMWRRLVVGPRYAYARSGDLHPLIQARMAAGEPALVAVDDPTPRPGEPSIRSRSAFTAECAALVRKVVRDSSITASDDPWMAEMRAAPDIEAILTLIGLRVVAAMDLPLTVAEADVYLTDVVLYVCMAGTMLCVFNRLRDITAADRDDGSVVPDHLLIQVSAACLMLRIHTFTEEPDVHAYLMEAIPLGFVGHMCHYILPFRFQEPTPMTVYRGRAQECALAFLCNHHDKSAAATDDDAALGHLLIHRTLWERIMSWTAQVGVTSPDGLLYYGPTNDVNGRQREMAIHVLRSFLYLIVPQSVLVDRVPVQRGVRLTDEQLLVASTMSGATTTTPEGVMQGIQQSLMHSRCLLMANSPQLFIPVRLAGPTYTLGSVDVAYIMLCAYNMLHQNHLIHDATRMPRWEVGSVLQTLAEFDFRMRCVVRNGFDALLRSFDPPYANDIVGAIRSLASGRYPDKQALVVAALGRKLPGFTSDNFVALSALLVNKDIPCVRLLPVFVAASANHSLVLPTLSKRTVKQKQFVFYPATRSWSEESEDVTVHIPIELMHLIADFIGTTHASIKPAEPAEPSAAARTEFQQLAQGRKQEDREQREREPHTRFA